MSAAARIQPCPACGKKNRVPAVAAGKPVCAACKAPLPWLAEATDQTFDTAVRQSKTPVLVDLWAPWCGPCRMVSPAVERMAAKYPGRLKVVKVNVDDSPGVAAEYNAMSIPTLLLVNEGAVVDRLVGAVPEPQLEQWVRRTIG